MACTNNFLHHHPLNLPHPPRHPLCQLVESLYELVRANVRKVDGNGSPLKTTGTQEERSLRVLIHYQGSAWAGDAIQDDGMLLVLSPDGTPERLADAVINFPILDGRRVLFIHDLKPYKGGKKEKKILLDTIEAFAESRGYPVVFIDTGRQKKRFLKEQGFHQIPGQMLAEKRVI